LRRTGNDSEKRVSPIEAARLEEYAVSGFGVGQLPCLLPRVRFQYFAKDEQIQGSLGSLAIESLLQTYQGWMDWPKHRNQQAKANASE
jgi:hypothetical protein